MNFHDVTEFAGRSFGWDFFVEKKNEGKSLVGSLRYIIFFGWNFLVAKKMREKKKNL